VAAIVTRAMRLQPAERYQTADEMLADVERVLRTDFQSAGQTELKLWLEQLSRRDSLESIGKHRVDTSGIVKDVLGTDLSAGTSFELDEVHEITTGMTELSSTSGARPPPTPPPVVVGPQASRPETAVERVARGVTPPPALTPPLVTAAVAPPRRRLGGFWLGAIFALGAVVGFRYLMGWADREGVMAKLGFGSDGRAGGVVMGPPEPSPPPPPIAKHVEAPPPVPVVAPPVTPAPDAALAVAETDAAAADAKAPVAKDDDTDDTNQENEEELLRKAVPNAEQAVIGADGAEPEKAAEGKRAPEVPEGKHAAKPKHETAILHLKTVPVGAIVKTKGQVLGRTPINLHFRTGNTYELTFVKNGYELANRRVAVSSAKDKTIALALKKRPVPRKHSFFHPHR
jgi:hypothetical protein